MTTKILALTDALGNLVRFVLLPGQRHDTVGVAPLIEGVEFEGLVADKAFDANWLVAELDQRGAKIIISQMPRRKAPGHRQGHLPMAPPDRELLPQAEGIQAHRHAKRQNRYELCSHDLSQRCRHPLTMKLNRP